MKVGTQLKAVRVKRTAQPWHEVAQLEHAPPCILGKLHIANLIMNFDNSSAMRRGIQAAMHAPEMRTHRIEELRAQIEAGTYEIDSMALAQKMLNVPGTQG